MPRVFYMDVHVPSAVTAGLRLRGVEVLTSQEDGTQESDDEAILRRATELGFVLFTQDDDLLAIASRQQQRSQEFSGVVYCHQLGCGIGGIIEDLELLACCADADELHNRVVYLPLS
jgi:Domain of unknown function (DUF5615)